MKKFNASDLTNKRREILKEARKAPVIIQSKNTNGEVLEEFAIVTAEKVVCLPVVDNKGNESEIYCMVLTREVDDEQN